MMKLASALSVLILGASMGWAAPHFVKQTSDGYLNVRSGPGTGYDILRQIYPGDKVDTIEQRGRWFRVRLPRGGTGWVSGNFLTAGKDIRVVKQTNDGFLNVRRGPGTGHGVSHRLHPDDQVEVLSQSGNWLKVRNLKGPIGWVHRNYVY